MKEKNQDCHMYFNFDGVSMEIGVNILLEERGHYSLLDMLAVLNTFNCKHLSGLKVIPDSEL